jgi:hypothetical protein
LRPFGTDLFVAQGRGVDEVYNVFIMLTCAIVYSAVYLGSWGFLKDWANIASIEGFLFYSVLFFLANLVVIPGLFYIAVLLGKAWAEKRMPTRQEAFEILEPLRAAPAMFSELMRRVLRRQAPAAPARGTPIQLAAQPVQRGPAPKQTLPPLKQLFVDYGYALAPLGLIGWIAFTVSFALIDISYAIPLLSDPFGWGWNLFGTAKVPWMRFIPEWVPYIQTPILLFGLAVSIIAAYKIVRQRTEDKEAAFRSVIPVAIFMLVITALFFQLYV